MSENSEENKHEGEELKESLKPELDAAAKDKDFVLAATPIPPAPSNEPEAPAPVEKHRRVGYMLWVRYNDLSTLKVSGDQVEVVFEERQVDLDTKEILERRPMRMLASRPVHSEILLQPFKGQG